MKSIGYQWLVEKFDLNVCDLLAKSYCISESRMKDVEEDGLRKLYYPVRRISVNDTWQGNLVFAIKNEGVNLEVLNAFFATRTNEEMRPFVMEHPTGSFHRRLWFFYEYLTGRHLDIADVVTGNYVDAVDEEYQVALSRGAAVRERRYRVMNNLIGTRDFCPMIRKTVAIKDFPAEKLKHLSDELLNKYSPELLYRAVQYLYIKETKSSFAIERETPDQRRMDRFISILKNVSADPIDKSFLISLQNVIVEERYAQKDWRTDQVYVGETLTPDREKVHFIAVKPEDVEAVMRGFLSVLSNWISEPGSDPVIIAAVMSFAFVFIHPFDDGNGRLHRYLMHHILTRKGFTPPKLIFPVSAVLLKHSTEYDWMLETFSKRLMSRLDYVMDSNGEVKVRGDSVNFYRYVDYTPIVERFQQIIKMTIETEWKVELDYLVRYDRMRVGMRAVVDMPEKKANQFILFVRQNDGKLSSAKRKFFPELSEDEIRRLEIVVNA